MNSVFKSKALMIALVLILGLFLVGWKSKKTEGPKEFYKDATVIWECGPSGSTVGIVSRFFAKYFAEITGARVLVEPHREIAGLKSMNLVYNAKPDGLTLGCHIGSATVMNWLFDDPVVKYDPEKFNYIGAFPQSPMALWVKADGPYNTLEKLKKGTNLKMAGGSPIGYMSFWGTLAGHLLDLDFKTIVGVGAPPTAKLSVLREETDFTNIVSNAPGMAPELKPLASLSFERSDLNPDVPALPELVELTEKEKKMLKLTDATELGLGMFIVAPPETPQDRVEYIRKVFSQITARDDFASEVKKVLGRFDPRSAEEIQKIVHSLVENKTTFNEIRQLINKHYI